ncbi:hypothetical protein L3Q82_009900 [Scortum barcoo]|uniref:Uncharacterized protein n=1 Tax=Scortum barcoo TaxID=214431 RepID=A0ACB8WE90_9TELE|nr:hypothetical protein L3Q82_009900 [Scortum barcoo]
MTALIQTQKTVMAAEGEEVTLNCQLVQSKEVVQVTWQKVLPEGTRNLATYNKYFGPKVNLDLRDKVEVKDAGLQNSSIVIMKVTEQDEGCYHCLFNIYPDGALTGSTCLQLYELHEPVLHVGGSNSPEEAVVSCSATGRPAPTVTLSLLQPDLHLSNYSSVTVTNANATVTVTTTAVLSGLRGHGRHTDFNEESGSDDSGRSKSMFTCVILIISYLVLSASFKLFSLFLKDRTLTVVLSVFGVCVCTGIIFLLFKHKKQNSLSHRGLEMNEMPQTSHSDETEAPSVTEENIQIRQRPSPVKKQMALQPKQLLPHFSPAGLTALIQTQKTVMAAEGEEVTLNCQLVQSKEVIQVTWQKVFEGMKNLATYNKYFGPKVSPDFRDKVEFKDAGLQNCSIVIMKVTEQDEGCYHCLFNIYPDGALTGSTCLQLYELHEPVLHVGGSNSSEEAVVSCSATGRPAPTVTLSLLQPDLHLSNYSSVTVTNANATVTFAVTTTAVLSGLRGHGTQVGCAVRVLSGPQIEVFLMIPEVKQSSDDGEKHVQRY